MPCDRFSWAEVIGADIGKSGKEPVRGQRHDRFGLTPASGTMMPAQYHEPDPNDPYNDN